MDEIYWQRRNKIPNVRIKCNFVRNHAIRIEMIWVYCSLQVVAQDLDSGMNALMSYTITGGNDLNKFIIDTESGVISVNEMLDRETVS